MFYILLIFGLPCVLCALGAMWYTLYSLGHTGVGDYLIGGAITMGALGAFSIVLWAAYHIPPN